MNKLILWKCLLECYTMLTGKQLLIFRGTMLLSVNIYQLKWCNITDLIFHPHCYENLTSCKLIFHLRGEILTSVQNVHIFTKQKKKSTIYATASSASIGVQHLSSTQSHTSRKMYVAWAISHHMKEVQLQCGKL